MGITRRRATFTIVLALLLFSLFRVDAALSQVYLNKEQALTLILGPDTTHNYDPKPISKALREKLAQKKLLGAKGVETAHFFIGRRDEVVTGYALIDSEVGKHLPMTYIVGISPTGEVSQVELMVFREVRGWEVKEPVFVKQFKGKRLDDELKVGRRIRHVSGATLSSIAIAKGVKRALFLWHYFYGKGG